MRAGAWLGGVAIVLGLIVLLALPGLFAGVGSPPTSHTIVLFVGNYAAHGGAVYAGTQVVLANGSGVNRVHVAPTVNLSSGSMRLGISSRAMMGPGSFSNLGWVGIQNLTFTCGARCATGNHSVYAEWFLTDVLGIVDGCPSRASAHGRALTALGARVVDVSVTPHLLVASSSLTLWDLHLSTPGGTGAGDSYPLYQNFSMGLHVALTSGHRYQIAEFYVERTWAVLTAGHCSIASYIYSGLTHSTYALPGPTVLKSVAVS